jgi:hypothetical protein
MITGHEIHEYLGLNSKQDSHGVYAGFQEIDKHRAHTKIGRSKNAQAIQRGRAQGGANWWFISYFMLPDKESTHIVEKKIKETLRSQNIEKATQRQTELYYLSPEDASDEIEQIIRHLGYEVRDLVSEILVSYLKTPSQGRKTT